MFKFSNIQTNKAINLELAASFNQMNKTLNLQYNGMLCVI